MLSSNPQRPYFCLHAIEDTGSAKNMENIVHHLKHALNEPDRASEFEGAIEKILRNNGFDPRHDLGWKESGVTDGRAGALREIRKAYLMAVPDGLKHLGNDVALNPYEYTPSALPDNNPLAHVMSNLQRAHIGKDISYLTTDEAWAEAGVANIQDLQKTIRGMFMAAKVGGYVAHELKLEDSNQSYDYLSVGAADYAIQKTFPELAVKLGIPADIKRVLIPQQSIAATDFGHAHDFKHS